MSLLSAMGLTDTPQTAGDFALQAAADPINLAMIFGPILARKYPRFRHQFLYGNETANLADRAGVKKLVADASSPAHAEAVLEELAGLRERNPGLADLPEVKRLEITTAPDRIGGLYHDNLFSARRMKVKSPEPYESLGPTPGWIYADRTPLSVVRHEFGHHIFHRLPDSEQRAWDTLLQVAGPENVSAYAAENPRVADTEGFAETMAAMMHPQYQRGSLPGPLESFIDALLSGERQVAWRKPPPSLAMLLPALGLPSYNAAMALQALNSSRDD